MEHLGWSIAYIFNKFHLLLIDFLLLNYKYDVTVMLNPGFAEINC